MMEQTMEKYPSRGASTYDFLPQQAPPQAMVREYDIASLEDHRDNHFSRMSGEQWREFVGSIREHGVISPLLIREKSDDAGRFEILAGHNRKYGAAEAGLTTVPCIAVDVDDVEATVLIGITNRQREEVTDLEWGWAYRTTLETLRHQGIAGNRVKLPGGTDIEDTFGERSIDVVARKYGVSRKTAQRKIRLTYLIPQLYDLGKQKGFSQKMLIDLSYLPKVLQTNVVQAVVIEGISLTESLASRLRAESSQRTLSLDELLEICHQDMTDSAAPRRPREKKYEVPEKLFPRDLPKKQRQDFVTAALTYIRDHRITLDIR